MARIRFTARSTRGGGVRFVDAIIETTRPVIRAAAEATGKEAQRLIVANIGKHYGKRKGKPRSDPLANTNHYLYRVNTSTRGAQLVFKIQGTADFKAKFGALNFGAPAHMIAPVEAPWLANKEDNFFSKVPVLWTPTNGSKWGTHFYEDGIQEALDGFASRL